MQVNTSHKSVEQNFFNLNKLTLMWSIILINVLIRYEKCLSMGMCPNLVLSDEDKKV
jgi:hypothetical protein